MNESIQNEQEDRRIGYPRLKRYRSASGATNIHYSVLMRKNSVKMSINLMLALGSSLVVGTAFAAQGFNMKTSHLMDADHDGKITKEEYMKHSKDMAAWKKMDTNQDGVLDANEIQVGFNSK